jgi:thiol-disulfide isomerase/thioredoxin
MTSRSSHAPGRLAPVLAAAALPVLALTACGGSSASTAPAASVSAPAAAAPTPAPGTYLTYDMFASNMEMYTAGKAVLFFDSQSCEPCRAADTDLTANASQLPVGTSVVHIDMDAMSELRTKYGVSEPGSFVLLDAAGTGIKTWTGSETVDEIAAQLG